MNMTRLGRPRAARACVLAAAAAVAVAATSLSPPAVAAAQDDEAAMVLIMDASGSMKSRDDDGRTLLDGAKGALHDLVDELPDEQHVGLRVYGHRYPNTDRENGCRDTELIHPVGPLDREALRDAIDGFDASGFTPIGLSLREAARDLPPEGPRTIVLVSDGEETCDTDPCAVAEDLRADGIELVINTVGFALDDNDQARDELSCIAEAGGGRFVDVDTAAELSDALAEAARESRAFEAEGGPLEGAPIPRDAETGSVDTPHTDVILFDEINFYRFEIVPGSEVRGEMIVAGNPTAGEVDSEIFCPNIYLTDAGDRSYASGPFPGDHPANDIVKHTDTEVVDTDEVWIKIESKGCHPNWHGQGTSEFDVEIQLTVLDSPAPPPVEDDDTDQAAAPGADADESAPQPVPTEPTSSSDDGMPGWVVPVLILLGLAVVGLGVAVLRQRSRTPVLVGPPGMAPGTHAPTAAPGPAPAAPTAPPAGSAAGPTASTAEPAEADPEAADPADSVDRPDEPQQTAE